MKIWLGRGLIALSAVLLGFWLWVAIDSRNFQHDLARRLAQLGPERFAPTAPLAAATRHEARTSGLVGRIEIPRLGLSAMVVEGTSDRALLHGVGHLEHTAFPGEHGNVTLAGHRDTYFRKLRAVARGDRIRLRTPDGVFVYQVDSVLIVKPTRTDLLAPTRNPTLTLVTCYPFHWIGPAPDRFIIRASQETGARSAANPQARARQAPGHEPLLAERAGSGHHPQHARHARAHRRIPTSGYALNLRWS